MTSKRITLAIIAAVTGFCANLAQVSLFRLFMGLFYGTEMHLGIFLAIWLGGISMGGLIGGRWSPQPRHLLNWFVAVLSFSVLAIFSAHKFLPDPQGGFLSFYPVVTLMFTSVFPVSCLIGMLLPALLSKSKLSLGVFYSYEAIGSFFAGVFFSFILGGTASPVLCLLSLPIFLLSTSLLASPGRGKFFILLLLAPAIAWFGPKLVEQIERNYWKMANPSQKLIATKETPYQKLQLCSYYEQKSLFANGMLSGSWPMQANSEQLVHSFVTALRDYEQILVLGAPPPDVIEEFIKYQDLNLSLVELDPGIVELYDYSDAIKKRIKIIIDDPRRFVHETKQKFDGIMIYPVSPVTLSGNRLFTIEAFTAMKNALKPQGVLSLQVSGTENYLGSIKEQIILSTWQGLGRIFPYRSAMPGNTITFFACQRDEVLPDGVKTYMKRFRERKIPTTTFMALSFFNILQPFRVQELDKWLNRSIVAHPNTDSHPESFTQQLELWNIYSGTLANSIFASLQQISLRQMLLAGVIAAAIFLLASFFLTRITAISTITTAGVAISGATGILCEIILILLYQNSYGAAYQMTAFFFGIYMLGLASGAWLFGIRQSDQHSFTSLKLVKLLQILFTVVGIVFIQNQFVHGIAGTGTAIFIIAFLDGIEFPLADRILRSLGRTSANSAGMLLFADNAGALFTGLGSGLWLLPTIGMRGCFILLAVLLSLNLLVLMVITRDYQSE